MALTARPAGRWCAAMLCLLLPAGCALPPTRPALAARGADGPGSATAMRERIARDPAIVEVGPDWIRHPQRGMLEVLDRDAEAYWVARPAATTETTALRPAPPSLPAVVEHSGEGVLREIEAGLPTRGQWRDNFVLEPGSHARVRVFTPPPRKNLGPPRIWTRATDGRWQPEPAAFPPTRFDYGGIARGDFDGDGHRDLALGMHLRRFGALFGNAAGGWQEQSTGLPGNGETWGSGVALAALPGDGRDHLLLLREFDGVQPRLPQAPGLAEYRWDGRRWRGETIDAPIGGKHLALLQAPGCPLRVAVAASRVGQMPVFERQRRGWRRHDLDPADPVAWFASALAPLPAAGSPCPDLISARWRREGTRWIGVFDRWTADGAHWHRAWTLRQPGLRKSTAMAAAGVAGSPLLLVGDDRGGLDLYRAGPRDLLHLAHLDAPRWRRDCAVSHIAALPATGGSPAWLVAFAGDNDLYDPGRCGNGGGLAEIHWLPTQASAAAPAVDGH